MSIEQHLPVVGLIGGIGSGKSAVARWVAGRRNVAMIDGDSIGHDVLKSTPVKNHIRTCFGHSVFDEKGDIIRAALGREVFGSNPRRRQAREKLERIVHPEIRKLIESEIAGYRAAGTVEAVILDAAVLLEAGWNDLCDSVVFVDAPRETRLQRVAQTRGWSEEEFLEREASQLPLDDKRTTADHTIDNSGDLEQAGTQLERILSHIADKNLP